MKLFDVTWPEVSAFSKEAVVLVPTGSVEQHGHHLPLGTDSILVTAIAEAVERGLSTDILLTPTIWLGASAHHMAFAGTLNATYEGYEASVFSVLESLHRAGFWKFMLLNGHGGNTSSNDIVARRMLETHPEVMISRVGYYEFWDPNLESHMRGPIKGIAHACELETSLMLHVSPERVHMDRTEDDGLRSPVPGLVTFFDTMTERGVLGYPTHATAETGKAFFESAVTGIQKALRTMREGFHLSGPL